MDLSRSRLLFGIILLMSIVSPIILLPRRQHGNVNSNIRHKNSMHYGSINIRKKQGQLLSCCPIKIIS